MTKLGIREKDRDTLSQIKSFDDSEFQGMCATSPGEVSHMRRLERLGLVECVGRRGLHPDFHDPYQHAEGSEYLSFVITTKGRSCEKGANG